MHALLQLHYPQHVEMAKRVKVRYKRTLPIFMVRKIRHSTRLTFACTQIHKGWALPHVRIDRSIPNVAPSELDFSIRKITDHDFCCALFPMTFDTMAYVLDTFVKGYSNGVTTIKPLSTSVAKQHIKTFLDWSAESLGTSRCATTASPRLNTIGHSSTYLAIGYANVQAGTYVRRDARPPHLPASIQ